jgi:sulfite reductase beta subunit-like hemoprotein
MAHKKQMTQKQARDHFRKMAKKAKQIRKPGEPFHKAVKRAHKQMK